MDDTERYQQAKGHVARLRRFYSHLATFVFVGGVLFFVGLANGQGFGIFWPLGIWGLLLVAHAVRLFVLDPSLGPAWEERKISEYMNEGGKPAGTTPPAHGI